jgi:hypothetical protein
VIRRSPKRRISDPRSILAKAQGEFHEARTFLAIAARVLDRVGENPADPALCAPISAADVCSIMGLGLKQLDAAILHLDRGLTDLTTRSGNRSPERRKPRPRDELAALRRWRNHRLSA